MSEFTVLPQLSLSEALREATGKLTQVKGRARRSEYWWTYLACCVLNLCLSFVPFVGSLLSLLLGIMMIPLSIRRLHDTGRSGWWYGVGLIGGVVYGVAIVISFASSVVAGEDFDPDSAVEMLAPLFTSPLFICATFAYLVYGIVLLVFFCSDSKPGTNKYGPSPKYIESGESAMCAAE